MGDGLCACLKAHGREAIYYCCMAVGEPWGGDSEFAVSRPGTQRCVHLEHLSGLSLSCLERQPAQCGRTQGLQFPPHQVQGRLGMPPGALGAKRNRLQPARSGCSWTGRGRSGALREEAGVARRAGRWRGPQAQLMWQARQEPALVPFVGPVSWPWWRRAGTLSAWQIVQARCVAETE